MQISNYKSSAPNKQALKGQKFNNCFDFAGKRLSFEGLEEYYLLDNDNSLSLNGVSNVQISSFSDLREAISLREDLYYVIYLGYSLSDLIYRDLDLREQQGLLDFPGLFIAGYRSVGESESEQAILQPNIERYQSLISDDDYILGVEQALEEIKAGNTYEINLSRPFQLEFPELCQSQAIYEYLYQAHQAPYAGYIELPGDCSIISMSPECYLQRSGETLSTFPIKGTRPVFSDPFQDQAMRAELLSSEKELAEHLMVVDLERNDMGRICQPGSVEVEQFAELCSFEYVHHLVSRINGRQREGLDFWQIVEEFFPGGSITGAPKASTISIINGLEQYQREGYTGALGYLMPGGDFVFNILIRSLFMRGSQAILNVGGGIVYDSDPLAENMETYHKARGFLNLA